MEENQDRRDYSDRNLTKKSVHGHHYFHTETKTQH